MTIPWMEFVPDISGVCSIAGTFEITSKPRKTASDQDRELDHERVIAPCGESLHRAGVDDARAGGDLVVEVERQLPVRGEMCEQATMLRA